MGILRYFSTAIDSELFWNLRVFTSAAMANRRISIHDRAAVRAFGTRYAGCKRRNERNDTGDNEPEPKYFHF